MRLFRLSVPFMFVPGSQQQRQTLVAELLFVALGGHGGGVDQTGICGAPLLRDQPEPPGQHGLKLWTTKQEGRREETGSVQNHLYVR